MIQLFWTAQRFNEKANCKIKHRLMRIQPVNVATFLNISLFILLFVPPLCIRNFFHHHILKLKNWRANRKRMENGDKDEMKVTWICSVSRVFHSIYCSLRFSSPSDWCWPIFDGFAIVVVYAYLPLLMHNLFFTFTFYSFSQSINQQQRRRWANSNFSWNGTTSRTTWSRHSNTCVMKRALPMWVDKFSCRMHVQ